MAQSDSKEPARSSPTKGPRGGGTPSQGDHDRPKRDLRRPREGPAAETQDGVAQPGATDQRPRRRRGSHREENEAIPGGSQLSQAGSGLHRRLRDCTIYDRARLRSKIERIRRTGGGRSSGGHVTEGLDAELAKAVERRAARARAVPRVTYPPDLPVSQRRELIAAAVRDHQVTVVCGETGSGKTTQLPKICLELGLGVDGMIGHTQPRRLAARSVGARIAKELGVPLGKGSSVGYQVRFDDRTDDTTLVKLMTDGILLSETQADPRLLRYDTIIIDEAHERSLNIDFLLGYLARLLPKRRDLKILITSATINPRRFAEHFASFVAIGPEQPKHDAAEIARITERASDGGDETSAIEIVTEGDTEEPDDPRYTRGQAIERWGGTARRRVVPVVRVSGRTHPVTVKHLEPDEPIEGEDERDVTAGVIEALGDLLDAERRSEVARETAGGDVLVFLAGEREIRETAKAIRDAKLGPGGAGFEVLPLYARLAAQDQDKIFASTGRRKIVLSTNIAETSLTVPGITYVIDPGQARISRYAARSRVQRLPIEAISRASADQRKGRCGRVAPGVCYRLYGQADFEARDPFTDPEILRTNLAGVILQMRALKLGAISQFPFVEAPRASMVREGEATLHELGALDEEGRLTPIGRQLARLPLDPRLGRMILAAAGEGCLAEAVVITSALSTQDPRERPADKRDAADRAHEKFLHEGSDFLTFLNLWKWYHDRAQNLGSSRLRKACIQNYLNHVRMREWVETHRQLREIVKESGLHPNRTPTRDPDAIHRALLSGLLTSVGFREGKFEYQGPGHTSFFLWPGSGQFDERPKWVMAAEIVETEKRYARTVAPVDPEWVEELGPHLVTRTHSDPRFNARKGKVMASERILLNGLTLIPHRSVHYGPIDPRTARELFIYHGLVLEEWDTRGRFMSHNRAKVEEIEAIEAKKRKRDVLVEHHVRYAFYDRRIPEDVYTGEAFESWRKQAERTDRGVLFMSETDLMSRDTADVTAERFPDAMPVGDAPMPLSYKLEPGTEDDGVTITVPVEALGQLDEQATSWLVPGMVIDKVAALVRALPKDHRRALGPANDIAKRAAEAIEQKRGSTPFVDAVADAVSRLAGTPIPRELWRPELLPDHLRMNVRVIDESGKPLSEGRDIPALKRELRHRMRSTFEEMSDDEWTRDGITDWDFGDLPERVQLRRGDVDVNVYPALVDGGASVKLRLFETTPAAARAHRKGLRRLFDLRASEELRTHAAYMPGFEEIAVHHATIGDRDTLRDQLRLLLADQLFIGKRTDVRTQKAFDARLAAGWHRVGETVHAVCDLALEILKWHTRVRLLVDHPPGHLSAHAHEDIATQLGALVRPGFLSRVPVEWLVHYPRFLRAIELRIDRSGRDNGARDDQLVAQVLPHWRQYRQVLQARPDAREASAEFDHLGWMIEEFRVSLFAQELRTSITVSDKRLRTQWPKCRL